MFFFVFFIHFRTIFPNIFGFSAFLLPDQIFFPKAILKNVFQSICMSKDHE